MNNLDTFMLIVTLLMVGGIVIFAYILPGAIKELKDLFDK